MSALLWAIAAGMQLAAVIAYGLLGFGLAFVLLEIFVLLTFGLTVLEIAARSKDPGAAGTITRIVRSSR